MKISRRLLVVGLLIGSIVQCNHYSVNAVNNVNIALSHIDKAFTTMNEHCLQSPDCQECNEIEIAVGKLHIVMAEYQAFRMKRKSVKGSKPSLYKDAKDAQNLFKVILEDYRSKKILPAQLIS